MAITISDLWKLAAQGASAADIIRAVEPMFEQKFARQEYKRQWMKHNRKSRRKNANGVDTTPKGGHHPKVDTTFRKNGKHFNVGVDTTFGILEVRKKDADPIQLERELFIRGKQILGQQAGGLIVKLLKAKHGNVALARSALETASTKQNPREYVVACLKTDTPRSGIPGVI